MFKALCFRKTPKGCHFCTFKKKSKGFPVLACFKNPKGSVCLAVCDKGCDRSKSSSSDSSAASNKKTKKKQKSAAVAQAEQKSAKKQLEVFSLSAVKEQTKKDKEKDRLRCKEIAQATTMIVKVKKALQNLQQTLTNPLICHVPAVTLEPLNKIVHEYEHRIKTLQGVEKGEVLWNALMATFSPKDGASAQKPVIAILAAMNKFKK